MVAVTTGIPYRKGGTRATARRGREDQDHWLMDKSEGIFPQAQNEIQVWDGGEFACTGQRILGCGPLSDTGIVSMHMCVHLIVYYRVNPPPQLSYFFLLISVIIIILITIVIRIKTIIFIFILI